MRYCLTLLTIVTSLSLTYGIGINTASASCKLPKEKTTKTKTKLLTLKKPSLHTKSGKVSVYKQRYSKTIKGDPNGTWKEKGIRYYACNTNSGKTTYLISSYHGNDDGTEIRSGTLRTRDSFGKKKAFHISGSTVATAYFDYEDFDAGSAAETGIAVLDTGAGAKGYFATYCDDCQIDNNPGSVETHHDPRSISFPESSEELLVKDKAGYKIRIYKKNGDWTGKIL